MDTRKTEGFEIVFEGQWLPEHPVKSYRIQVASTVLDTEDPQDDFSEEESQTAVFVMLQGAGHMQEWIRSNFHSVSGLQTNRVSKCTNKATEFDYIDYTPPA